jgi:hypothetical protein
VVHPKGSEVKATLQSLDDRVATFLLGHDLQGQLRASDLPSGVTVGSEILLYVSTDERRGSMVALATSREAPRTVQRPKAEEKDSSLGSLIKEHLAGNRD